MTCPPAPLTVRNLSVQYRQVTALRALNLDLPPGHLIGIIGPNGAGKSTLLKALLGLIPASGEPARYGDRLLRDQLAHVAYMPQRSQIDWSYPATVWDVVLLGRVRRTGWLRRYSAASHRLAWQALERVEMQAYRDRPIGQLSGGQQQRVFLARSLAQEAQIFCLDEPFTGVDRKTEAALFRILHELAAAGKTVLVVHHDLGEAIAHFDDLVLLNQALIAAGPRPEVLRADALERAYGGSISFSSGSTRQAA